MGFGAVMDGVGNSVKQATGNIEKAVIEIIDMRESKKIYEPPIPAENQGPGVPGLSLPSLDTTEMLGNSAMLEDSLKSVTGMKKLPALSDVTRGMTRKRFYVQFNPNTLTISGYGGGMVQKTDYSQSGGGLKFDKMDVHITLNVTLIFDQVNPKDAFMMDKFAMSGTGIATGIAQGVMKGIGKLNYSVQPQVEGFIAALRNKYTRMMTFNWGDMCYTGIINRVSSKYTMFSVSGQPIRGEVTLSMVCADKDISKDAMGIWKEKYEKAFSMGSTSFTKANQRVGNLVNFNL